MIGLFAIPVGTFPQGINELLGAQFFSYVLPWLFTFAVIYGILSHIGEEGIPQSNAARVVIGVILALIITPSLSPYVASLMRFSAGFVMLVAGLLVVIVLLEVLGLKVEKPVYTRTEEGEMKPTGEIHKVSIFEAYPRFFAFIIGVLAVIVFFASGAGRILGIQLPSVLIENTPLWFFLGAMVIIVGLMISESE